MFLQKKYFWLLLFLFVGCNKENTTETAHDLFGLYESSTFVESGPSDGGIDIQSSGGYLNILLKDNFDFNAELFIPENVSSNYPTGDTNFSGKYLLVNDIIQFTSSFIVDELEWDKESKKLESLEVPSRGLPFKIILYRSLR